MAEPPKPPSRDDDEPRASFTDDDRDVPLPHESRSWITGRKRKVGVLRVDPDTLPKSETKSEPAPDKTDVEKATDAANAALTERLEQSPTVQKAIADEAWQQNPPVGYRYIEIGSADKNKSDTDWQYNETQAPQAYQIANDIANAAAIARAAEEARQEVIKRYREEEKAKSDSGASGQAELQLQREKMREEDRRRADLRKQEELVERREALRNSSSEPPKSPEPPRPEQGSGFGLWSQRIWKNDIKPLLKATPTWIKWAVGLFLFGLTMIQIAEYLFALLSFIASGVFFSLWIASWDGWPNRSGLTKLVKTVLLSFIVGGFVIFTLILISIKGSAPWSHLTSAYACAASIADADTKDRKAAFTGRSI